LLLAFEVGCVAAFNSLETGSRKPTIKDRNRVDDNGYNGVLVFEYKIMTIEGK